MTPMTVTEEGTASWMASRARALEEFGALLVEKLCAGDGVAGDGLAGFGAVGQAGSVAEEGETGLRGAVDEGAQDSEAAEAGIEDADGGRGGWRSGWGRASKAAHGWAPSVGTASAAR